MSRYRNRFWDRVERLGDGPDDCWEWIGHRDRHGYGTLSVRGRTVKAIQVSWFLEHGVWPSGHLLHACDNPPCIRPSHLTDGTATDNMRDAAAKGRLGHHLRKLTEADALAILQRPDLPAQHLAHHYGVSRFTIYNLRLGRTFKHLSMRKK